jgi:hypothetical protein
MKQILLKAYPNTEERLISYQEIQSMEESF